MEERVSLKRYVTDETTEELEDIRIHDEALAEMERTGARPRPLKEALAEIEREEGGS